MMLYLDNAATSFPKPESVYSRMDQFARQSLANPGRAGHRMAVGSEQALHETRHLLNQFFHGAAPDRFIFTLNGTDALNMAIKGILKPDDHVVTTNLEHNSVSRPLVALEQSGSISLTRVECDSTGYVTAEQIASALTPQTKLVAITHASNVLGTVQPIESIGGVVSRSGALLLVDAAQTAGVVPIDVQAMHIDLLAFPGHKGLLGPTGTGALYVAPETELQAWREGGTGGDSSSPTQPVDFPFFLEGGTPNVHGVVGLGQGLRHIESHGIDKLRDHELDLAEQIVEWARRSQTFQAHGQFDRTRQVATISLCSDQIPATEVGAILDEAYEIAIRPGLHCAPYIHRSLGTFPDGTVRISPGPFNTTDDIRRLCAALDEIAQEVACV